MSISAAVVGGILVGAASLGLAALSIVALLDSLEALDSPDALTQALGPYFAVAAIIGLGLSALGVIGAWRAIRSSGERRRLGMTGGIGVFGAATFVLVAGFSAPIVPLIALAAIGVTLLGIAPGVGDPSS